VTSPVVDEPRLVAAPETTIDPAVLRAFRSFVRPGMWFEREAEKVVRQAASLLARNELDSHGRVLLAVNDTEEVLAVSVLGRTDNRTAELAFVGVRYDLHGATIESPHGRRLSDSLVEASLDEAAAAGYKRMIAYVAREHVISQGLLARAGFVWLSRFDSSYDLWAVSLDGPEG
jgi:L-amino acid N-acyltransferase YncA